MNETDEKILAERARAQARRPMATVEKKDLLPAVCFLLHPEIYAIENSYVKEVLTMKNLTPLPGTPPFVMGIVNYRGEVVSAVNLKRLFGLREMGLTEFNKILIVSNGIVTIGIVADAIQGYILLQPGTLSSPPMTISESARDFFRGIAPEGLILLDASKLLQSHRIEVDQ